MHRIHKWSHKSSVTHGSLPISIAVARFPITYENLETKQGMQTLMVYLHCPTPSPRQGALGFIIMCGNVFTAPTPRPMYIYIVSVHILSLLVSTYVVCEGLSVMQ